MEVSLNKSVTCSSSLFPRSTDQRNKTARSARTAQNGDISWKKFTRQNLSECSIMALYILEPWAGTVSFIQAPAYASTSCNVNISPEKPGQTPLLIKSH